MTEQRPAPTFERYPFDPDAPAQAPATAPATLAPTRQPWTPAPPPPSATPNQVSRRLVGFAAAGGFAVLWLWGANKGSDDFPGAVGEATPVEELPPDDVQEPTGVGLPGGPSVDVYPGWKIVEADDTRILITLGVNRFTVLLVEAEVDGLKVTAEATAAAKRYAGDFVRTGTPDVRDESDLERAEGIFRSSGRVGSQPGELEARVVHGREGDLRVLTVVTVLLDDTSDLIRKQLSAMRKQVLNGWPN